MEDIQLVFGDKYKYVLKQEEYYNILKKKCHLISEMEELTKDEDSSIIYIPRDHHGFEAMIKMLKNEKKEDIIKDCEFYVMWEMCLFFGCDTILYETIKEKMRYPNILNCLFVMLICDLFEGVPRSVYNEASRMIRSYHTEDVQIVLIPDAIRISKILKEVYGIRFINSDMLEPDFWKDLQMRSLTDQVTDQYYEEEGGRMLNSFLKVEVVSINTLECSYIHEGEYYRWKHTLPGNITLYMLISSKNDGVLDGILFSLNDNEVYKLIFEKLRLFYNHEIITCKMNIPELQEAVIDFSNENFTVVYINLITRYYHGGEWSFKIETWVLDNSYGIVFRRNEHLL